VRTPRHDWRLVAGCWLDDDLKADGLKMDDLTADDY
jgi:hypothetical protein